MNTHASNADRVLELLRQLPPRDRLRVLAEALPELEQDLPDTTPYADFWEGHDMNALVKQQRIQAVQDFDTLLGGWPDEEPIDDFIAALREWRQQNPAKARL